MHHITGWMDRVPQPFAPQHNAEGQGSPPPCIAAQGGGTRFPTHSHHITGWRDQFSTPMHDHTGQRDNVLYSCPPRYRAEGPGSPPLCTTARGRDGFFNPRAPHHTVEGQGSLPLCTRAKGGRTPAPTLVHHDIGWRNTFPSPMHHNTGRRDNLPHPCAPQPRA